MTRTIHDITPEEFDVACDEEFSGPEYVDTVEDLDRAILATARRLAGPDPRPIVEALGALGVIGEGYCFCSEDRDPDKTKHQPECRDARAALDAWEKANG